MSVTFRSSHCELQQKFEQAQGELSANVKYLHGYSKPVLIEGADYPGAWLECAPHEGLLYASTDAAIARNNHEVFFAHQHADGYLPCWVWERQVGRAQIQMVVPIAATAWELYQLQHDRAFLEASYAACARWDAWLCRHRDTRGTGLCEAFCEFDTGHDNSPRFDGLPRECAQGDARNCPASSRLPYLAPDLSATMYGGRLALANMAWELGRHDEAEQFQQAAKRTQAALLRHCFDERELCFYDRDRNDEFVRIRSDVLLRVLGEGVAPRSLFERVYARHVKSPSGFWPAYPFPSIAVSDPQVDARKPVNSWGWASQALTALRAPRWMCRYGKHVDLDVLMTAWLEAILRAPEFWQQVDPHTGAFTARALDVMTGEVRSALPRYTPSLLLLLDFVARLYGVRREAGRLHWACNRELPPRANTPIAAETRFELRDDLALAEIERSGDVSVLSLNASELMRVRGQCLLVTDLRGTPRYVIGTAPQPVDVEVVLRGNRHRQRLLPDELRAFN